MKIQEFRKSKYEDDLYICMCNGEDMGCGINHSGTYVLKSESNERIKVLEDALKYAIDSMDNDCDYEENHRSASEQARAALEVK
jgi:hypothetical protein